MQGAQKLRREAHLLVRRNDEVEAQRSRWNFYETIMLSIGNEAMSVKAKKENLEWVCFFKQVRTKRCKISTFKRVVTVIIGLFI